MSGGKDSHFQVYTIKEKLKMNPLLLTAGNIEWTETGQKNLENISDTFGCDMIMFYPNRRVARIMFKKAFEELGSPSWYLDSAAASRLCHILRVPYSKLGSGAVSILRVDVGHHPLQTSH